MHMYTFPLARCFETHRLCRGAYFVHADSCTFLFILRFHFEGSLGAHRLTRALDSTFPSSLPPRLPPFPLFSLYFSKISKSMTRRRRTTTVLFEQRVTFLARRFLIEMLMKCDDSGKLLAMTTSTSPRYFHSF